MVSAKLKQRFARLIVSALVGILLGVNPESGVAQQSPARPWTPITETTGRNIDEVALARAGDGALHVVWLRENGTLMNLMHTAIGPDGGVAGSPATMLEGWVGINNPDLVVERGGGLRVLFGAMRSTDIKDAYSGGSLYSATAGPDGSNWALQKGAGAVSGSVHASPVGAVVTRDGTVIPTWTSGGGLYVRLGLDPAKPDQTLQTACCAYQSDVATDTTSGEVVLGWYSNATKDQGLFTQTIAPAVGGKQSLPGSAEPDRNSSLSIDQRIGITGRQGAAGVFVAYGVGYPTFKHVSLWRHGGGAPVELAKGENIRHVNITSAPEGRLWVVWADGSRLFALRSNKEATDFGSMISVAPPGGTFSVYKLKGEGSLGPLDLFTAVSTSPSELATWHTQVFPPLALSVSPKTFVGSEGATVSFTVSDVGDAVEGATVTVAGKTATTNAQGRASIDFPKGTKPATLTAQASKKDYSDAGARITVSAPKQPSK